MFKIVFYGSWIEKDWQVVCMIRVYNYNNNSTIWLKGRVIMHWKINTLIIISLITLPYYYVVTVYTVTT